MSDSGMTEREHPMGKMPSEGTTGNRAWGSRAQARKTKADIPGRVRARQEVGFSTHILVWPQSLGHLDLNPYSLLLGCVIYGKLVSLP